jgi:putative MATE family efflux protein
MFVADTKMVGLLPGPGPLAACGIVGPLLWSITVIFTVFAVGTTALVARAKGEGDEGKVRAALATSFGLAGLLGLPVAAAGILGARPIVHAFAGGTVSADVLEMAVGYLRFTIGAFPFDFLAIAAMAALRGAGDTRTPMLATLGANLFNVVGNYFLIYGHAGFPRLGVPGAGLATGLAGVLEAGFLLLALARGSGGRLRFAPGDLRAASRATLGVLARVSGPSALEAILFHGAFLLYQRAVFALGEAAVAAHRVAITLESIAFMPAYGFHIAAAALSGQMLGARDPARASRGVVETARIGTALMGLVSLAFLALPSPLASLFSDDPGVLAQARRCLPVAAVEIPFLTIAFALSGGMRGAGATRGPLLATLIGAWGLRVPLAYLLGSTRALGLPGIWVATTLDWATRTALLAWLFRRGAWKEVRL